MHLEHNCIYWTHQQNCLGIPWFHQVVVLSLSQALLDTNQGHSKPNIWFNRKLYYVNLLGTCDLFPFSSTKDQVKFFHFSHFGTNVQTWCMSVTIYIDASNYWIKCFKSGKESYYLTGCSIWSNSQIIIIVIISYYQQLIRVKKSKNCY